MLQTPPFWPCAGRRSLCTALQRRRHRTNLELIVLARLAPEIDLREHECEPSEFCLALGVQAAQFLLADGIGFRRTKVFLRTEVFLLAHAANKLHFCRACCLGAPALLPQGAFLRSLMGAVVVMARACFAVLVADHAVETWYRRRLRRVLVLAQNGPSLMPNLIPSRLLDEPGEQLGGVPLVARHHVGVDLECDRRAGVAETLADHLDRDTLCRCRLRDIGQRASLRGRMTSCCLAPRRTP